MKSKCAVWLILTSFSIMQLGCTTPRTNRGYCLNDNECETGKCNTVTRRCTAYLEPTYVSDAGLSRRLDMLLIDAAVIDAYIVDAAQPDLSLRDAMLVDISFADADRMEIRDGTLNDAEESSDTSATSTVSTTTDTSIESPITCDEDVCPLAEQPDVGSD